MDGVDRGAAYAEGRRRITDMVRLLHDARLEAPVPACPEWRVRDVIAHLAGICADVLAGNVDGSPSERWTAAQVDARRGLPVPRILEDWERDAAPIEGAVAPYRPTSRWVFDLVTHEHDLRGALGVPRGPWSQADTIALSFLLTRFGGVLQATGRRALRIRLPDQDHVLGVGEPIATLRTDPHTLIRALPGRRSLSQLHALDWSGEPTPHLSLLAAGWGPFRAAPTPITD
jgi:uncharacterized protein (TIGR03083 family)